MKYENGYIVLPNRQIVFKYPTKHNFAFKKSLKNIFFKKKTFLLSHETLYNKISWKKPEHILLCYTYLMSKSIEIEWIVQFSSKK